MPGGFELFDRTVLIYNPVNRRVPLTMAESMRSELGRRLPDVPVALQATQHAGHARELASAAAATGRPLIIAVSGDGVYNELVNRRPRCVRYGGIGRCRGWREAWGLMLHPDTMKSPAASIGCPSAR